MTEKEHIQAIVQSIPYPVLLGGSGVMIMHGIDRELGDLDLAMATQHWFKFYHRQAISDRPAWEIVFTNPNALTNRVDPPYLERVVDNLRVNIFFSFRVREDGTDRDFNRLWAQADMIKGITCIKIEHLLRWKQAALREKDLPDIEAILKRYPELNGDTPQRGEVRQAADGRMFYVVGAYDPLYHSASLDPRYPTVPLTNLIEVEGKFVAHKFSVPTHAVAKMKLISRPVHEQAQLHQS